MDKETYKVLSGLKLEHVKLIKLETVETQELLKVKKSRNKSEYSWTLKSSFMSYLFKKYPSIPSLFYFDADIFFFRDIKLVYDDLGNKSLAITPHRFPKNFEARTKTSGIFNAGVVFIKRDSIGLKALERWRVQCIDWCYQKPNDKRFGDQMYLDEWPTLYKDVHQFQHPGINLAPWNANVYKVNKEKDGVYVNGQPLIFYHFHEFKIYSDLTFEPSYGHSVPKVVLDLVYKNYEKTILDLVKKLNYINPDLKLNLEEKDAIQNNIQKIKRFLLPVYWRMKTIQFSLLHAFHKK
jgi:hypothetical protein